MVFVVDLFQTFSADFHVLDSKPVSLADLGNLEQFSNS